MLTHLPRCFTLGELIATLYSRVFSQRVQDSYRKEARLIQFDPHGFDFVNVFSRLFSITMR